MCLRPRLQRRRGGGVRDCHRAAIAGLCYTLCYTWGVECTLAVVGTGGPALHISRTESDGSGESDEHKNLPSPVRTR
eukprot:545362-Pyramimonas_sp.AAC.1